MCFLIQSKQTNVRQVVNRLNDRKKRHLCASTKKNVLIGTKRKKEWKKKKNRNIITNIQWTFLQWEISRCEATGNVDVILQSEVDQTDKINTIISHDPEWAGKHPVVLTEHWRETIHHTHSECDDSLLVVCQILHRYEEQLLSTFYFLLILQEVWRRCSHWHCTRLDTGLQLSWCNWQ